MAELLQDVDGSKHDGLNAVTTVNDATGRTLMTLRFEFSRNEG